MNTRTRTIASLLAGLAFALSAANHFLDFWQHSPWFQVGVWLGGGLAAAAGISFLSWWLSRRRADPSRPVKLVWLAACLGAAALFTAAWPSFTPLPARTHTLTLEATGQKEPRAAASEVHLTRVKLDEETLPFEALQQRGIWQLSPGEIVSDGPQPAHLVYRFKHTTQRQVQLNFAAGPTGGQVVIGLDGTNQTLDLYDAEPDKKRVLQLPLQSAPATGWRFPLQLADTLTLGTLLFLLLPFTSWLDQRLPDSFKNQVERLANAFERGLAAASAGLGRVGTAARRAAPVVLVNLVAILAIIYLFEGALRFLNPSRKLPPNGKVDDQLYTWGNLVKNNSYGFREREVAEPKPQDACRIMVLGDSLTWGQGLAVEERYTNVLEDMLHSRYPDKPIEVLNFGIQGLPTTQERDILAKYKDRVEPDQVVVGFCYNDPQPNSQDYVYEKVLYDQQHPFLAQGLPGWMEQIGLKRLAERYRTALTAILVRQGVIPDWPVGVERTYQSDSKEWQAFTTALEDIKHMSDEMGLPQPVLAVLSEGSYPDRPVNFSQPDPYQASILKWGRQAESAASAIGFRAFNTEAEIAGAFVEEPMGVNFLDAHPNARANQIYAQKLFEVLSEQIEQGVLCP